MADARMLHGAVAAAGLLLATAVAAGCGGRSDLYGSDATGDPGIEADAGLDALVEPDQIGDADGEEGRAPASDFALTDLNPLSATYGSERRVSEEVGKVLVVYFANYT